MAGVLGVRIDGCTLEHMTCYQLLPASTLQSVGQSSLVPGANITRPDLMLGANRDGP